MAGVATVEAIDELRCLMVGRGLPTISQALGVALQEWLARRRWVHNLRSADGTSSPEALEMGVKNPADGGTE